MYVHNTKPYFGNMNNIFHANRNVCVIIIEFQESRLIMRFMIKRRFKIVELLDGRYVVELRNSSQKSSSCGTPVSVRVGVSVRVRVKVINRGKGQC